MSIKHPIISVTGSSGAGTTSVRHTFEHIFRREDVTDVHAIARFEPNGVFRIQDATGKVDQGEFRASATGRMKGSPGRMTHSGPRPVTRETCAGCPSW